MERMAWFHPPSFLGQEDPLVLEDWIRSFDKLFEVVNCPPEKRVDAAVYYLQQGADNWWYTKGPALRQRPNFGWEDFKEELRDRFYPEHIKAAKYDEFLHLKQGGLSVQEYHARFLELARCVPALVADEVSKVRKFIHGLNFETREAVCVLGCRTLSEAYSQAANHYREQRNAHKQKRKAEESGQQADKKARFTPSGLARNFSLVEEKTACQTTGICCDQDGNRHYYCMRCGTPQ